MKHYFFINPVAGKGNKSKGLIDEINAVMLGQGDEYEIVFTEPDRGSERRTRTIAEKLSGEAARFYACGGDGTANEIATGIMGFENIEFGIIPIGSGNDMIRNFPEAGDFLNISSQINGDSKAIDVMSFFGIIDGKMQSRYCLNMFNIGFDCNVVETALRLKKKRFIMGEAAYQAAIFINFVKKKGVCLDIYDGDELVRQGNMLLCAISNGSFCGGGIKSAPQALVDDGHFDLNIVNDVSRIRFLKLLPRYKEGTHLDVEGIESTIQTKECKRLSLRPNGSKEFFFCVDGEIARTEGIDINICERAIRFIVPVDVN